MVLVQLYNIDNEYNFDHHCLTSLELRLYQIQIACELIKFEVSMYGIRACKFELLVFRVQVLVINYSGLLLVNGDHIYWTCCCLNIIFNSDG